MSKIYAFANQKGGVGKTTTAVNLSAYLASAGKRILVIDVDPQTNASASLGINHRTLEQSLYDVIVDELPLAKIIQRVTPHLPLYVAPASPVLSGAEVELVNLRGRETRLRTALRPVRDQYDYIFIDCPPSLGLLTVNALSVAHSVIIPVQCEYLALEGLTQLMTTINLVRRSLNPALTIRGLLMTMYDGRANLSQQVVDQVRQHFAGQVFQVIVPRNVRLSEAPSYGQTILTYAPKSPGGLAYKVLAEELLAGDSQTPQVQSSEVQKIDFGV
jgi:chromosome partitioning protein